MKKHVIALGRQFGSGGREIGRKLSESLGFAYYDRELLKLAAERAEVGEELFADKDEKAGNPWLFKAFYQGGPKVKQGQSAEDVLFQMQSEIIRELAEKEDCIIVGRCADLVLTGQDVDCLSLFICAPFEWRVHHRMELENLDEKAARALVEKTDANAYYGKPGHFIGHLQTNKIKKVLGRASLIQSVDSEHLLAAIEKEAAKAGIVQDVLLEVNIGGEESKSGVSPEQLWPLLDAAAAEEHIRVKGLMAIPPVNDDDAQNRRYLAQVYKLFVQAGERGYQNVKMETLSMGMSGDFENAIREGATLVRIGTAIYGERDYSKK